jgi:hypothetical protein
MVLLMVTNGDENDQIYQELSKKDDNKVLKPQN